MAILHQLKGLSDPVRLRIVRLLVHQQGELCVCHLTSALALPQSTVSRHLAVLRNAGLVTKRRDGKWMHYGLSAEMPQQMVELLRVADDDERTLAEDRARLDDALPCD